MNPLNEPVIGIDLGTRYALTAIADSRGTVQILPNRWGGLRTPSFVALTPDGFVAGEDASRLALRKSENVWWDVKRHLGTDWVTTYAGKTYTPEDLLQPLLRLLREDAEAALKKFVHACVLAVPAHFSFPERGAVARAAERAGFRNVRIVNEPTAAALSVAADARFLVIEFGAGTLDVSIVEGDSGVFQVIESTGRHDVGGYDLDRRLAEWIWRRYATSRAPDAAEGVSYFDCMLPKEDMRWPLLLSEAERIKVSLSDARKVNWMPPAGIFPEVDLQVAVTRKEFEDVCLPIFEEILKLVERLWFRHKPERLVLVGGSSRIPLLRDMLAARICEPEHLKICPEEAVCVGAAQYAKQGRERLLIDVLSRGLGIESAGTETIGVLERGTPLPAQAKKKFVARGDGTLEISVVQGEGRIKNLKRTLQKIEIENVRDGESVEILFRVDGGGLLHVEIHRRSTTQRKTIALDADDADENASTPSCDLLAEIRSREEALAKLSIGLSDSAQQRLFALSSRVRSLAGEEASLQWQALEAFDKMIEEFEQVMS